MEPVPLPEPLPVHINSVPNRTAHRLFVAHSFHSPLHRRRNRLLKRAIDLFLSTVLILFLFPWFLPLVALAIRIGSRGPVFFRQRRHKQGGRLFYCIKLRTMVVNDRSDILAAFDGDYRITRIGKLLRRTHLDELPQLLNVWMGDMSMVGPRPHMISENQYYAVSVHDYPLRHQVKPGITGLAQIRGYVGASHDRDAIRMRVLHDMQYIQNWSLRLDLKIMLCTLLPLFTRQKQPQA